MKKKEREWQKEWVREKRNKHNESPSDSESETGDRVSTFRSEPEMAEKNDSQKWDD